MFDEHYPDGGLLNGLQLTFRSIASPLEVTGKGGARIEKNHRFSQVYTADEEGIFLYNFWERGEEIAHASSPDLLEVARSIHAWVEDKANTDQIRKAFPFINLDVLADTAGDFEPRFGGWERLVEKVMEAEWKWERLEEEARTQPDRGELLPLIVAARKRKELRQLFPFTSVGRLCLSRCTVYPFSGDCPYAVPTKDWQYQVFDASGKVVGRGDNENAVQLLIDHLPPNCGPAIKGTAEDF